LVSLGSSTKRIRDRTIVETETTLVRVWVYPYLEKRDALPEPTTALATSTPFATLVAAIPSTAISSACSCIESRIPIFTSTRTVEQPLTLTGDDVTVTSTVQEVITTQTQSTLTEASLTTTFTTSTITATLSVLVL
jgi:hypothetical protein